MLLLRVLGGLSLENNGSTISGPAGQRKRLSLLAMLACAGDRGVTREKLLGVFWPESDTERARGALKQSLYTLRRELGGPEIVFGSSELRLNGAAIQCDAQLFERALAAGDLEQAVAVFSGPLLDGVHIDDAPGFERWLDVERDRLDALNRSALRSLAVRATERGDHAAAVEWWKRLARVDPLSASTAVGLMSALVATGDRPAALQHARVHEQLLKDELDVAPDLTVTSLVSSIRQASGERFPMKEAASQRRPAVTVTFPRAREIMTAPIPRLRVWRRGLTIAALGTAAVAGMTWWPRQTAGVDPHSIVVLPPLDKSLDPSFSPLVETIYSEIIAELARATSLQIRSEYSAKQYSETDKPISEIARELGVAIVVHGSVRAARDSLHVRFELIHTSPMERHLAIIRDSADRENLSGLAPRVAGRILAQVLPGEMTAASLKRASGSAHKVDAEAYAAFANGRFAWSRMKADSIYKAMELYQFAIALDSTFARAHVALAEAYGFLPYYAPVAARNAFPAAKEAARKALMLDSTSGEAYAMLGWATLVYDLDWRKAEEYMRRAIELSPGYGYARMLYAWLLTSSRRFDDAIRQDLEARASDPLSPRIRAHLGIVYELSRQYDLAIAEYRGTLERDSGFVRARSDLGRAYLHKGDYSRAIESLTKALAGSSPSAGGTVDPRSYLAEALAKAGERDSARALTEMLVAERRTRYIPPLIIARMFVALGDLDTAFEWFDRAYEERDPDLILLDVWPSYDSVREDPRFRSLLRKVGFRG